MINKTMSYFVCSDGLPGEGGGGRVQYLPQRACRKAVPGWQYIIEFTYVACWRLQKGRGVAFTLYKLYKGVFLKFVCRYFQLFYFIIINKGVPF